MTLLSPLGLLLLLALPVLVWLALRAQRPRTLVVGTLLIWRRVAAVVPPQREKSRRLDLLLYVLLAACALAALGAARPAPGGADGPAGLAIFVESLGAGEPGLDSVLARAAELAGNTPARVYAAAPLPGLETLGPVQRIVPGPIEAELAQFETATPGAPRLLFLAAPTPQALRLGRVLPRLETPRAGVVFEARAEGETLLLRQSDGPAPAVSGASLSGVNTAGGEQSREYRITAGSVRVTAPGQDITLARRGAGIGVGPDWNTDRHAALLAALRPEPGATPGVWLGSRDREPAVRVNQGSAADLSGTQCRLDWRHPLFAELPLAGLDLAAGGRVLEPAPSERVLARAWRDGQPAGALAVLSADGRVLRFAGDPFAELGLALAVLLLDNAVGVVTGTRPSQRQSFAVQGDLPSRRQALAGPFEPEGELSGVTTPAEPRSTAHWLLALAALGALAAA
ncbi:MAG: BatA domain-containing protein, partial [Planctomycetes bacterium]|nr:BatA domain-containing protein [Planctomycetota bacterium]